MKTMDAMTELEKHVLVSSNVEFVNNHLSVLEKFFEVHKHEVQSPLSWNAVVGLIAQLKHHGGCVFMGSKDVLTPDGCHPNGLNDTPVFNKDLVEHWSKPSQAFSTI